MAGRIKLKVKSLSVPETTIIQYIAAHAAKAFRTKVGPHLVEVARHRAPVSKPRNFNPRDSSFENLRIADRSEGRFTTEEVSVLRDLSGLSAPERARFFRKAFGSETTDPSTTKFFRGTGVNKDRAPDVLRIRRGTIQGAFAHKPGFLRDSIRLDDVSVTGGTVKLVVRAHAPYAWYVHEGRPRPRAPKPFLRSALANVKDEVTDPSTYKG